MCLLTCCHHNKRLLFRRKRTLVQTDTTPRPTEDLKPFKQVGFTHQDESHSYSHTVIVNRERDSNILNEQWSLTHLLQPDSTSHISMKMGCWM